LENLNSFFIYEYYEDSKSKKGFIFQRAVFTSKYSGSSVFHLTEVLNLCLFSFEDGTSALEKQLVNFS